MVERPIKRSERKQEEAGEDQGSRSQDSRDRNSDRSSDRSNDRGKGRGKGKGKGKGKDERDARPPMNPALMRGPKPSQAKPLIVEEVPEAASAEENLEATPVDESAVAEVDTPEASSEETA